MVRAGTLMARIPRRVAMFSRVARTTPPSQAGPHRFEIEVRQVRLASDLAGGAIGNDAQLGLRLRQGRLDVEPGLEARGFREQRPHPWVVDPERSRLFLHESDLSHGGHGLSTALEQFASPYFVASGPAAPNVQPPTPPASRPPPPRLGRNL